MESLSRDVRFVAVIFIYRNHISTLYLFASVIFFLTKCKEINLHTCYLPICLPTVHLYFRPPCIYIPYPHNFFFPSFCSFLSYLHSKLVTWMDIPVTLVSVSWLGNYRLDGYWISTVCFLYYWVGR